MNETAHSLRELVDQIKPVGDVISIGALLGYVAQLLPMMATLLTVIWMAIRIYETDTVQSWLKREAGDD